MGCHSVRRQGAHDALLPQDAAHLQGLDVRNTWRQEVGRDHQALVSADPAVHAQNTAALFVPGLAAETASAVHSQHRTPISAVDQADLQDRRGVRAHRAAGRRVRERHREETAALPGAQVVVGDQLRFGLVGGVRLPAKQTAADDQLELLRY